MKWTPTTFTAWQCRKICLMMIANGLARTSAAIWKWFQTTWMVSFRSSTLDYSIIGKKRRTRSFISRWTFSTYQSCTSATTTIRLPRQYWLLCLRSLARSSTTYAASTLAPHARIAGNWSFRFLHKILSSAKSDTPLLFRSRNEAGKTAPFDSLQMHAICLKLHRKQHYETPEI